MEIRWSDCGERERLVAWYFFREGDPLLVRLARASGAGLGASDTHVLCLIRSGSR